MFLFAIFLSKKKDIKSCIFEMWFYEHLRCSAFILDWCWQNLASNLSQYVILYSVGLESQVQIIPCSFGGQSNLHQGCCEDKMGKTHI